MENNTKEPTLEEYGLTPSSYDNYRNQKEDLEESFREYKKDASSGIYSFLEGLLGLLLFCGISLTIGFVMTGNFIPLFIYWFIFWYLSSISKRNSNKINEESKATDKKIDLIKSEVVPFEESCVAYYKNYLEQFYQNNIYNKRSGSEKFEETLSEFSSMIDEVSEINKRLIFTYIVGLSGYRVHLHGSQSRHEHQKEKKQLFHSFDAVRVKSDTENIIKNVISDPNEKVKEEFRDRQNQEIPQVVAPKVENEPEVQAQIASSNNLEKSSGEVLVFGQKVENSDFHRWTPRERDSIDVIDDTHEAVVSESIREEAIVPQKKETAPIVPPEKKYRTARKIDNWEEINRKRKITGTKGEEIALAIEQEYFESIGRKDLADRVRHVSVEDGDGLGYDILSFFDNGKEKYIEVKSTTVSIGSPFNISSNELGFLREHMDDSFVCRVLVPRDHVDGIPGYEMVPGYVVLDHDITPTAFIVKPKKTQNHGTPQRSVWERIFVD